MVKRIPPVACLLLAAAAGALYGADVPQAEIDNGQIRARLYLPDPDKGYYQATRFDWSGVVGSLEYNGHNFFGTWNPKRDPKFHDSITGPVEEYRTGDSALGYEDAKFGGTFIRIGVGVLRKPEEERFQQFKTYQIIDPGRWTVDRTRDSVTFTQELADPSSGYAYVYRKTVRLMKNAPRMVIEHSLRNTGKQVIQTNVYNHNFLVVDSQPTGPDFTVKFPFDLTSSRSLGGFAEVLGNELRYVKEMQPGQSIYTEFSGFGDSPKDFDIRVENAKTRAGVRITGDQPLWRMAFWSTRAVVCPEPYIDMKLPPGAEFEWRLTYEFYTL